MGGEISPDKTLLETINHSRQGARFRALFGGDITGYDSTSEADLALAS